MFVIFVRMEISNNNKQAYSPMRNLSVLKVQQAQLNFGAVLSFCFEIPFCVTLLSLVATVLVRTRLSVTLTLQLASPK